TAGMLRSSRKIEAVRPLWRVSDAARHQDRSIRRMFRRAIQPLPIVVWQSGAVAVDLASDDDEQDSKAEEQCLRYFAPKPAQRCPLRAALCRPWRRSISGAGEPLPRVLAVAGLTLIRTNRQGG